jgi:hypothetical protein
MHPGRKVILLSCIDVKSFDGVGAVHNCVSCAASSGIHTVRN